MGKLRIFLPILLIVSLLCGCALPLMPSDNEESTAPSVWLPPESPYTPEDFTMGEDGILSCTAGNTVLGIDVSKYQKKIDWKKVADAGVKFAMIRLGNRGNITGEIQEDPYANANLTGAREAGILIGAYFYSQAIAAEEAREEAEFAMNVLGDTKLDLPLVYDWEYVREDARTGYMDAASVTECTIAFCEAVKAGGYTPMVYFNSSQSFDFLILEEVEQYPWWLAKYDLSMDFVCRTDMWQYTSKGRLPGISTKVDINLMFTDWGIGKEVFAPDA